MPRSRTSRIRKTKRSSKKRVQYRGQNDTKLDDILRLVQALTSDDKEKLILKLCSPDSNPVPDRTTPVGPSNPVPYRTNEPLLGPYNPGPYRTNEPLLGPYNPVPYRTNEPLLPAGSDLYSGDESDNPGSPQT
jgi:hypothetical protein